MTMGRIAPWVALGVVAVAAACSKAEPPTTQPQPAQAATAAGKAPTFGLLGTFDCTTLADLFTDAVTADCSAELVASVLGKLGTCAGLTPKLVDGYGNLVDRLTVGPGSRNVTGVYVAADGKPINCGEPIGVTVGNPVSCVAPATTLWPPNHEYRAFDLRNYVTANGCTGKLTPTIARIYSDEPEDISAKLDTNDQWNGDGHTKCDIVITGGTTFQLRSERAGSGNGRVYTVEFYLGTDQSTIYRTYFNVPHDQDGDPAEDSYPGTNNPHYPAVTSTNCTTCTQYPGDKRPDCAL